MGDESGYIRFEEAEAAQKARAAAVLAKEEGLVVKNFIATLEPVTGEHQNWLSGDCYLELLFYDEHFWYVC